MTRIVFQEDTSIVGRTWGKVPRKGERISLVSDMFGGRRRYRVVEVESFCQETSPGSLVFEPGEVIVYVVQLADA